ncbi:ABC transporter permease [Actinobaculum sp. 313]|uniref:ABC transporter permease n=1 Tax=Actinobaculum sp. 313 TaxID=2495645 RepID=UPI001F0C771D|nr:ABC transporter permease [Actinobaculum sp. 313]
MNVFRTSMKVAAAHRLYILIYLVLLSSFGLFMGKVQGGENLEKEVVDTQQYTVAVIDRDNSAISRGLTAYVESMGEVTDLEDTPRSIQDATAQDYISYIVIIPAGYGDSLRAAASEQTEVPLLDTVVNYRSAAGSLLDTRVNGYLAQVYNYLSLAGSSPEQAIALADEAIAQSADVELVTADDPPLPNGLRVFAEFSMYPMVAFSVVAITILLIALNRRPVRSRLSAAPLSGTSRNVSVMWACLMVGFLGWLWISALGLVFFGLDSLATSAPSIGVLGLALFAVMLNGIAIGFLVGQLGGGDNAANAVANIGGMTMCFLGERGYRWSSCQTV